MWYAHYNHMKKYSERMQVQDAFINILSSTPGEIFKSCFPYWYLSQFLTLQFLQSRIMEMFRNDVIKNLTLVIRLRL